MNRCNRYLLDHLNSHNQKVDPFLDLVASGRVCVRPIHYYGNATVVEIDLEHLATTMKDRLNLVFPFIQKLRNCYNCGSETSITDTIISDVNMMVDTAISITYNRLRHILELYDHTVCNARMNPRSPGSNRHKIPAFIASVLGSIGPLRIVDGPEPITVVYATSANRSRMYGRATPFTFLYDQFQRLVENLEAIGVPLDTIDVKAVDHGGVEKQFFHYWMICNSSWLLPFPFPT